jgi:hypothetical protein
MVTNHPHTVASQGSLRKVADQAPAEGFGGRVLDRMRQMFCGARGHDSLLQFEQDRMFLQCVSCGYESPGWSLTETPPTVTIRGDARRHVIARPQLVDERRVA